MTQNLYRSAKGKLVDMDKLMIQNELVPAISNVKINARGDELGPNGQIIRKREDVINDIPLTDTPVQEHIPIPPTTPRVKPQYVSPPVAAPAPVVAPTSTALVKTDDLQAGLKEHASDKSHKGKS
jgi:hypothetical protein